MLEEIETICRLEEFSPFYRQARKNIVQTLSEQSQIDFMIKGLSLSFELEPKFLDAYLLCNFIIENQPQKILEAGGFVGLSTSLLLEASASYAADILAFIPNIPLDDMEISPAQIFEALTEPHKSRLRKKEAFFGIQGPNKESLDVVSKPFGESFDAIILHSRPGVIEVIEGFRLAAKILNENGYIIFREAGSNIIRQSLEWLSMEYFYDFDFNIIKAPTDFFYSPSLVCDFPPHDHAQSTLAVFRKKSSFQGI